MLIVVIFVIIIFTVMSWFTRLAFQKFRFAIESYEGFLLKFEETPRSKYAKKYIPPMEPLPEESTIMDNTVSVIYNQKFSKNISNMTRSITSLQLHSSRPVEDNQIVEEILTEGIFSDTDSERKSDQK